MNKDNEIDIVTRILRALGLHIDLEGLLSLARDAGQLKNQLEELRDRLERIGGKPVKFDYQVKVGGILGNESFESSSDFFKRLDELARERAEWREKLRPYRSREKLLPYKRVNVPKGEEVREPLVDLHEEGDTLIVIVEMPGIDEKDIKLKIADNKLTISAETLNRKYYAEIPLPFKVIEPPLEKSYVNGILKLKLRKESKEIQEGFYKQIIDEVASVFMDVARSYGVEIPKFTLRLDNEIKGLGRTRIKGLNEVEISVNPDQIEKIVDEQLKMLGKPHEKQLDEYLKACVWLETLVHEFTHLLVTLDDEKAIRFVSSVLSEFFKDPKLGERLVRAYKPYLKVNENQGLVKYIEEVWSKRFPQDKLDEISKQLGEKLREKLFPFIEELLRGAIRSLYGSENN